MAFHKDLTGSELHEPKGADTATAGTVYVANGSGSGSWVPVNNGNLLLNSYWMAGEIDDISAPGNHAYIYVPVKSEMFEIASIVEGPITGADSILSIYINGVLFGTTLTVPSAGSSAGKLNRTNITTANTINAGSVIEVRSNGGSDTVAPANITIGLRAKT